MGIFERNYEAKIKKRKEELISLINSSCRGITIENSDDLKKIKLRNIESKSGYEEIVIDLKNKRAFNVVFTIIDNHYYKDIYFEFGIFVLKLSDRAFSNAHSKLIATV